MNKPVGMPQERWETLKKRATTYSKKGGTHGDVQKRYNQALRFYIDRWKNKPSTAPKGLKLSKGTPRTSEYKFAKRY